MIYLVSTKNYNSESATMLRHAQFPEQQGEENSYRGEKETEAVVTIQR